MNGLTIFICFVLIVTVEILVWIDNDDDNRR